jgi:hypothetical protein
MCPISCARVNRYLGVFSGNSSDFFVGIEPKFRHLSEDVAITEVKPQDNSGTPDAAGTAQSDLIATAGLIYLESEVNVAAGTVSAPIEHFSRFGHRIDDKRMNAFILTYGSYHSILTSRTLQRSSDLKSGGQSISGSAFRILSFWI